MIRRWLQRRFDFVDGDYARSLSQMTSDLQAELRKIEYEYQSLSARYDLLEQDRLNCRSEHWRLAIQLAMNSLHKTVADNLAKALMEVDGEVSPQVRSALEAWRDLSKDNDAPIRKQANG